MSHPKSASRKLADEGSTFAPNVLNAAPIFSLRAAFFSASVFISSRCSGSFAATALANADTAHGNACRSNSAILSGTAQTWPSRTPGMQSVFVSDPTTVSPNCTSCLTLYSGQKSMNASSTIISAPQDCTYSNRERICFLVIASPVGLLGLQITTVSPGIHFPFQTEMLLPCIFARSAYSLNVTGITCTVPGDIDSARSIAAAPPAVGRIQSGDTPAYADSPRFAAFMARSG